MSISVASKVVRRTGILVGVDDTALGTTAFWAKVAAGIDSVGAYLLAIRNSGDGAGIRGFQVVKNASNLWIVQGRNSADTLKLSMAGKTTVNTALGWHHVVASWNLTTGKGKLLINGVDDTETSPTLSSANIAYTRGITTLFDADAPATAAPWAGSIYDFAFWPGLFVDLTDAAEVREFISSDGTALTASSTVTEGDFANPGPTPGTRKPVAYSPELGRPAVFFTGGFTHNMGSGGPFDATVAFAEDLTEPAAYRQSGAPGARPGERSFDSEKSGFTYPRSKTFIERREGVPGYGLRMGLDERSGKTRDDNLGYRLSHWIFQDREEDDEEYDR